MGYRIKSCFATFWANGVVDYCISSVCALLVVWGRVVSGWCKTIPGALLKEAVHDSFLPAL